MKKSLLVTLLFIVFTAYCVEPTTPTPTKTKLFTGVEYAGDPDTRAPDLQQYANKIILYNAEQGKAAVKGDTEDKAFAVIRKESAEKLPVENAIAKLLSRTATFSKPDAPQEPPTTVNLYYFLVPNVLEYEGQGMYSKQTLLYDQTRGTAVLKNDLTKQSFPVAIMRFGGPTLPGAIARRFRVSYSDKLGKTVNEYYFLKRK